MPPTAPELTFMTRLDFRAWLAENAESGAGVWLIFAKTAALATLSSNDALEEALCFGWIDGQMSSIDATKYRKYFARRQKKSPWSDINKKKVEQLREKGIMTALGESAIATAKLNGMWDKPKSPPITEAEIASFAQNLIGISPAYENFQTMPLSVQKTYTALYRSFKTEDARTRNLQKIITRLNNNQKPM